MGKKAAPSKALSEVAFYYPGPMWSSGDALKNLLPASFGLTIAGAAWTLKTGDPLAAL